MFAYISLHNNSANFTNAVPAKYKPKKFAEAHDLWEWFQAKCLIKIRYQSKTTGNQKDLSIGSITDAFGVIEHNFHLWFVCRHKSNTIFKIYSITYLD